MNLDTLIIQLGIGGLTIYLFYRYTVLVTKKMMNGITSQQKEILEKQNKLLDKMDVLIKTLNTRVVYEYITKEVDKNA